MPVVAAHLYFASISRLRYNHSYATNYYRCPFHQDRKSLHFDSSPLPDIKAGEHVIVDTARGKHLGEVVQVLPEPPAQPEGGWKTVERRATPRDLLLAAVLAGQTDRSHDQLPRPCLRAEARGVKIVAAEYNYDGSRLAFLFSTETEDKPDLKSLRKDMQALYPVSQVEMRQIGPRDVAKLIGGMGACGLETRCCSKFLTDFSPISIKMAKEQGISLTPTEITGMCGVCAAA